MRAVDDLCGHLVADGGGHAVHKLCAGLGQGHNLVVHNPLLERLGVLIVRYRGLPVVLQAGAEVGRHHVTVGVDEVRILGRLLHIVDDLNVGAACAGKGPGLVNDVLRWGVLLRAGQHKLHIGDARGQVEAGGDQPHRRVVLVIGPGQHVLDVVETALLLQRGLEVGQRLEGVLEIGGGVEHRDLGDLRRLLQRGLGQQPGDDHVEVTIHHADGIAPTLHTGIGPDLAAAEVLCRAAELLHRSPEGHARPRRRCLKDHRRRLAAQDIVLELATGDTPLQFQRSVEDQINLFQREIGQRENVPAF